MNFALIGSLLWFFTTPEKEDLGDFPKDSLINGGIYLIQNEADASVLNAWDPGVAGYRPGFVNTTKFRINHLTTWSLQYFKENRFLTVRSQSHNNTHNELALVVEQSRDGKRPDTYNRYWNITFAGRSFGLDRWLIIDCGKGTGNSVNATTTTTTPLKCLQNHKKGHRVELGDCDPGNRRQRWRFCLCSLPALPKGVLERDRVIERIHGVFAGGTVKYPAAPEMNVIESH